MEKVKQIFEEIGVKREVERLFLVDLQIFTAITSVLMMTFFYSHVFGFLTGMMWVLFAKINSFNYFNSKDLQAKLLDIISKKENQREIVFGLKELIEKMEKHVEEFGKNTPKKYSTSGGYFCTRDSYERVKFLIARYHKMIELLSFGNFESASKVLLKIYKDIESTEIMVFMRYVDWKEGLISEKEIQYNKILSSIEKEMVRIK